MSVAGVTHDSRQTGPGVVFVAVRGMKADGIDFVADALAKGAEVIVVGSGRGKARRLSGAPRVIEVEDERAALALMARNLNGRPDEAMTVVGVTGTNGKTTTCRVLAAILETAGWKSGLLGTVGYWLGDVETAAERTTPEAPDLHRYMAAMRDAGCRACVMEVSSHALDLKRVEGIRFSVAVFTNLTRDHLDHHQSMEAYFMAKARLFESLRSPAAAVLNADDAYGGRLRVMLEGSGAGGDVAVVAYGVAAGADVRIVAIETDASGCRVELEAGGSRRRLESPLAGRPNGYNVTAAAGAAMAIGIGWEAIVEGVAKAPAVPGRMERVEVSWGRGRPAQPFAVFVDYAHTDDALRSLLETVRSMTSGRVILVFGCGGDRDRTKRPLMGSHAARLADLVFVTSDNPRTERPEAIIEEILAGARQVEPGAGRGPGGRIRAEVDRGEAIAAAVSAARPGDSVIIAGKGHETYQILGDRVRPFDDRAVARAALGAIRKREGADGAA